jgi:hypothetical protein
MLDTTNRDETWKTEVHELLQLGKSVKCRKPLVYSNMTYDCNYKDFPYLCNSESLLNVQSGTVEFKLKMEECIKNKDDIELKKILDIYDSMVRKKEIDVRAIKGTAMNARNVFNLLDGNFRITLQHAIEVCSGEASLVLTQVNTTLDGYPIYKITVDPRYVIEK